MKKHAILWTLLFLALFSLTACSSNKGKDSYTTMNENIIQVKEFEVSTELLNSNTVAKGNVYVQNSHDKVRITIVASIIIGENDWGGVSFYIPVGWNISSALSSFPDGSGNKASDNAAIWNTSDSESEWKSFVEIGRNHSQTPTGGGKGTVFLELTHDENTAISDGLSLLVSVGSEVKEGVPVVGTESTSIEIDFNSIN
jgi:hypothetical protein